MTNIKKVIVECTLDYELFELSDMNRPPKHAKKIKKSILEKDLTPYNPILVKPMHIKGKLRYVPFDGQGRLIACKELGLPIYFICCDELENSDMAMLNAEQERWRPVDFLNFYVKEGKEDYINVKATLEECEHLTIGMLTGSIYQAGRGNDGKSTSRIFKEGGYRFPERVQNKSRLVNSVVANIKQTIDKTETGNVTGMVCALSHLHEIGVNFNELISQLKKHRHLFISQPDLRHFVVLFEKIYNYRKRVKTSFLHLSQLKKHKKTPTLS